MKLLLPTKTSLQVCSIKVMETLGGCSCTLPYPGDAARSPEKSYGLSCVVTGDELKMVSPLRAGLCLAARSALVGLLGVTLCGTTASWSSPRSPPGAGDTFPRDVIATGYHRRREFCPECREFPSAAGSGDRVNPSRELGCLISSLQVTRKPGFSGFLSVQGFLFVRDG